jgi:hypothetical protein
VVAADFEDDSELGVVEVSGEGGRDEFFGLAAESSAFGETEEVAALPGRQHHAAVPSASRMRPSGESPRNEGKGKRFWCKRQ